MEQGLILNPIFVPGIHYGFTTKFLPKNSHQYIVKSDAKDPGREKDLVSYNRTALAKNLQVPPKHLCFLHQIHSGIVIKRDDNEVFEADGHIATDNELVLTVQTADCVPILFYDSKNKIIGAAHAGWKGAKSNIISNTINAMLEAGSKEQDITAIIGPHISQESYEIGEEFMEDFLIENIYFKKYFAKLSEQYHFDLGGFVEDKLRQYKLKKIIKYNHDTFSNDHWFSYRRFTKKIDYEYGSIISFIKLW